LPSILSKVTIKEEDIAVSVDSVDEEELEWL
jgi:hypothetical protein